MTQAFGNVARMALQPGGFSINDVTPAPRTPFNARMGKARSYGITSIPFLDMRAVGKATGTTINDVVLAISAGALRRYLAGIKALPKESLVAAVPVSLREVGNTDNNNQVTGMLVGLATDIEEPVARLKAINAAAIRAKAQLGSVKDVMPQDFSFFGAPLAMTLMGQLASGTPVMDQMPGVTNVCISNVPGRRVPMYFAGAEVLAYYPVSIPAHGVAVNITVQSYCGRLDFGITACRKALPDAQGLCDLLAEEFETLKNAVGTEEAA